MAAFQVVDCDNIRETFTGAASTTITKGGAAANSRAMSSKLSSGDTAWMVARGGAEISVGLFTDNGTTISQTTVFYSSNSNNAVSFSSGNACEVYIDVPGRIFDELNLSAITVASATTCDIGAAQAGKIIISGTTTITLLGTSAHKRRFVHFSGALTLTHNATSLILPGAANIITAAGDTAVFMSDSSGNWRCYGYQRAAGLPIVVVRKQSFTASGTYTPDPNLVHCIIEGVGGGGGGGSSAGTAGALYQGGGGGSGGYSRSVVSKSTIGASQTVTIGGGGAGGASGSNAGAGGVDTSVGALCLAKGGSGGGFGSAVAQSAGGAGGVAGTGDLALVGNSGAGGCYIPSGGIFIPFNSGANSAFGPGALAPIPVGGGSIAGVNAPANGGGGGSGGCSNAASNAAGGNGGSGRVFITEYCSQ